MKKILIIATIIGASQVIQAQSTENILSQKSREAHVKIVEVKDTVEPKMQEMERSGIDAAGACELVKEAGQATLSLKEDSNYARINVHLRTLKKAVKTSAEKCSEDGIASFKLVHQQIIVLDAILSLKLLDKAEGSTVPHKQEERVNIINQVLSSVEAAMI